MSVPSSEYTQSTSGRTARDNRTRSSTNAGAAPSTCSGAKYLEMLAPPSDEAPANLSHSSKVRNSPAPGGMSHFLRNDHSDPSCWLTPSTTPRGAVCIRSCTRANSRLEFVANVGGLRLADASAEAEAQLDAAGLHDERDLKPE